MYKHRYIEEEIRFMAAHAKVILLVGPRQVGKSTLLQQLFPNYPVVMFNPEHDVLNARKDPQYFLDQFKGPVILDEIQFAPELLAYLKIKVDQSDAKGQYFLTGSQNLSVLRHVSESMAGRVMIVRLTPMMAYEITEQFSMTEKGPSPRHWLEHYLDNPKQIVDNVQGIMNNLTTTQAIWRGGYPGLINMPERTLGHFFDSYLETYVSRDIRTQAGVEQIEKFRHFVALLAALTSQEINYSQLGREITSHRDTAERWLDMVRATYLWRDVAPYSGNTIKRVTAKSKGYFVDTGLACFMLRIVDPLQLLGHPQHGALFETYVSNMIFSVLNTRSFQPGVYHWRTSGGAEVDLVLEQGNALYPIEIKASSNLTKHDARGLKAFRETYESASQKVMPGIIVYAGQDCYWLDSNVLAVPWNIVMKPTQQ
jgi:predicted AAA+ superfamily ATPase